MAVLEDSGMGEVPLPRVSDAKWWGMQAECDGGEVTMDDAWSGSKSSGGEDKGRVGWRHDEPDSCTAVGDVKDELSDW